MTQKPKKNYNPLGIFLLTFCSLITSVNSQVLQPSQYVDSLESLENVDVLVIGEEHDDEQAHQLTLSILRSVSEKTSVSLSLEMLEWDQQNPVDEFLSGEINRSSFLKSSLFWNNFSKDYMPLLDYSFDHKIPVICSNPPRRYVNKISREGILAFRKSSSYTIDYLPLAHSILRDRSTEYEKRLRELFNTHTNQAKNTKTESHDESNKATLNTTKKMDEAASDLGWMDRLILAQHTWDAGMSQKILQEHFRSGNKIIHLNGRFHSDFGGGVPHRLRKNGLRVRTISFIPENKWNPSDESKIADFVILTKRPIE
ncbi:ChaN family lipoprotein [Leptospira sp. GIMC2001]|uniref:ChaN family lipoprotein n=1 Tax=Leptospira sp. GIMC2001 TaxID=1513297 RepID=UPI00234A8297|nr:ChaN family lipoprotein [Leptospira sp. GIMC2001]WCL49865.1 ChaN family lipoprotein [Leptospira sp. GIMC2001]